MKVSSAFIGAAALLALASGTAVASDAKLDTSICAQDPISANGETAEDVAAWIQTLGAAFNMEVKIFQSIEDPGLKFITSLDPFYGLIANAHKGDQVCQMTGEAIEEKIQKGKIFEVPMNPSPHNTI